MPRPVLRFASTALILAFLVSRAACDVIRDQEVGPGENFTARAGAQFGGSAGTRESSPTPGIRVSGGSLSVLGARVFGGSVILLGPGGATAPSPRAPLIVELGGGNPLALFLFTIAAPGISVEQGTVVLSDGASVAGGNGFTESLTDLFAAPGVAVSGFASTVVIERGAELSGGTGTIGNEPFILGAAGLMMSDGTVVVRGGRVEGSVQDFGDGTVRFPGVSAWNSTVEVSGGQVSGISLIGSTLRVSGGVVGSIVARGGCSELRGGELFSAELSGGRLLIVGSDFNLPLGPVPIPSDAPLEIEGVLESGEALSVSITQGLAIPVASPTEVTLAAPGADGCS